MVRIAAKDWRTRVVRGGLQMPVKGRVCLALSAAVSGNYPTTGDHG